jgi:hypothetical protein
MIDRRTLLLPPLLACTAALLTLPGPAQAWSLTLVGSGKRIEGSGHLVEQARQVGAFSRVRLDGPFTVNVRQGNAATVTVRADDNLVPLISTALEGDTLVVKTQPDTGFRTRNPVTVNIDVTKLAAAELRGSGDLNLTGLKGDRFELALAGSGDARLLDVEFGRLTAQLSGSGDISAKGHAEEADFRIAGSGDVRAADLLAKRTTVSIAGSGDARVHASEALTANVAGSGDVFYAGNPPSVKSHVAGSGEIRPAR